MDEICKFIYKKHESSGGKIHDIMYKVAEQRHVNFWTLKNHYYRYFLQSLPKTDKVHGNSGLTVHEDRVLYLLIRHFARTYDSLSAKEIQEEASRISGHQFSLQWAYNYMESHSDVLRVGHGKGISSARTNEDILSICEKFADEWDRDVVGHKVSPKQIVNFDEKLVVYRGTKYTFERAFLHGRAMNYHESKDVRIGSMVNFINAAGELIATFWIIPTGGIEPSEVKSLRVSMDRLLLKRDYNEKVFFMFSETGYLTKKLFPKLMNKFVKVWKFRVAQDHDLDDKKKPTSLHCYLVSDQLRVHRTPKVVAKLLERNFFAWSFPPNVSFFAQALDDVAHACFENRFQSVSHACIAQSFRTEGCGKDLLTALAQRVAIESLSPRAIKCSFENTHLHPFSKEKWLERAREHLALPSKLPKEERVRLVHDVEEQVYKKLKHDRDELKKSREKTVSLELGDLKPGEVLSPWDLIGYADARKKKEEEKLSRLNEIAIKFKKRVENAEEDSAVGRCAVENCSHTFRGGKTWDICECLSFALCPVCSKSKEKKKAVDLLWIEHKKKCEKNLKKKKKN